jgi:PhzF family phenazine biosynthesis protein
VRIFTPAYEMPFAGHPTLGTAHVVRSLRAPGDALTLEMKAGIIPVAAQGDRWTLSARQATTRVPEAKPGDIAAGLGLDAADLASDPVWLNAGTEQMMVPVRSLAAVARASPDPARLLALKSAEPVKAYVFFDAGDSAASVRARFFFPAGAGMREDPATGSACANLGGWFAHHRPGAEIVREVSQGEEIGRPSTLYLSVRGGSTFVGGEVVELGRGTIDA